MRAFPDKIGGPPQKGDLRRVALAENKGTVAGVAALVLSTTMTISATAAPGQNDLQGNPPWSELLAWCRSSPPPVQTAMPETQLQLLALQSRRREALAADAQKPAPTETTSDGALRQSVRTMDWDATTPEKAALFPAPGAGSASVITVRAKEPEALFSVALTESVGTAGEATEVDCISTDVFAREVELVVPAGFKGRIKVERQDIARQSIDATIAERRLVLDSSWIPTWHVGSVSTGRSFRLSLPTQRYDWLRRFAELYSVPCATIEGCHIEDANPGIANTAANPSTIKPPRRGRGLERQLSRELRRKEIGAAYRWISEVSGRSWAQEFRASESDSQSEPLVVFFGLSGVNKTLLFDCRGDAPREEKSDLGAVQCTFAEPWQTTLQHADYFWVVFIEDALSPFETTVDVEFKRRATDLDYEEFDPRTGAGTEVAGSERRAIRVGVRRFRLREAPVAVEVAVTRHGSDYGLRQWRRIYRKNSERWWALGATIFVALEDAEVRRVEIDTAATGERVIAATVTDSFIFGGVSLRWPGVRTRALDQPNQVQRILWNLVPDAIAAWSVNTSAAIYGFSWPIWDRIYVTGAAQHTKHRVLRAGFSPGDTVAPGVRSRDVSDRDRRWSTTFGFSVDLFRTR